MQAGTAAHILSMDLIYGITAISESGELSIAEIENIVRASVKAGVPTSGTPAYFECSAFQIY